MRITSAIPVNDTMATTKLKAIKVPTPFVCLDVNKIHRAKDNAKVVNNIKWFVEREAGVGRVGFLHIDI